ncbi:MAG: tRNA guanosine(34) transglycosylase Tgt [Opitutaceae bacterium]|jgi:queuine tRNA-ribosyltransferase
MSRLRFSLEKQASRSRARAARFQTLHGEVQTPVFMPVGTQAAVKTLTVENLKAVGTQVLLANTYHLMLRPGPEVFRRFAGIHQFMHWDGPVLTDSGGFQIFSLPHSRSMMEEGARFASYVDGSLYLLSPETSIEMQKDIGGDIMMVLDQCIPSTAPYELAESAMELTHRWALRSLKARGESPQSLFGIVQGACHRALRDKSATFLQTLPFDGFAIGGLAVGETHQERYSFTQHVTDRLPANLPRYLMGVGTPIDLLEGVNSGVDMFDCIIPSQFAQRGVVFTSHGKLQLRRSVHKFSEAPLDAACPCHTCRAYSRAYLHHLIKSDEPLGWHLLSYHNLSFYHRLMQSMRDHILDDSFAAFYETAYVELLRSDEDHPPTHPTTCRKARLPKPLGDYDVVDSAEGVSSIRQISSGEVMHSVSRPSDEARRLYVEQSCLATRLLSVEPSDGELVLWDVGLGAATNAMAVLHCFEELLEEGKQIRRPLRLLSFERDLDPLRLAASDPDRFEHLRHSGPHQLLSSGSWQHASGLLRWELLNGDFLQTFPHAPVPDLIYYDPFSYKTDSVLWAPQTFEALFAHCLGKSVELYTYSASTAVRTTLLRAGFFVAAGAGTGPKQDTSIAFNRVTGATAHELTPQLLDEHWLARWRRSGARYPEHLPEAERPAFDASIEGHPQFRAER